MTCKEEGECAGETSREGKERKMKKKRKVKGEEEKGKGEEECGKGREMRRGRGKVKGEG